MALLERWRPSRELDRFRGEFDDLLERFGFGRDWFSRFPFEGFFREAEATPARPPLETFVHEGRFMVRTDLPGIDPKNIEIKVVGDVLTIKGSREDKEETKKADFFRREIRYGSFERSISLPEGIKAEDLKASYRDGVLELSASMPKEIAPKEVKIQIEGEKKP
jgi:HSP20 family protein